MPIVFYMFKTHCLLPYAVIHFTKDPWFHLLYFCLIALLADTDEWADMDDMTDEETGSCGTSSSDELMEDDEMEGNVSKEDCLIIHSDNND